MRVVMVVDKENSAIWRLAKMTQKYNGHHKVVVIPIHPKRPEQRNLEWFRLEASKADICAFEYWKSAELLRDMFPEVKTKASV